MKKHIQLEFFNPWRFSDGLMVDNSKDGRFAATRDPEIYENLRRAFVESAQKPTVAELSERFKIPVGTIYWRSSEEKWSEQRAAFLQRCESEVDAKSLILQALSRTDPAVVRAFTDVVLVGLQQLTMALSQIPQDQASSTKCQTISTASFAFKNFADGCKAIGIGTFAKELGLLGKEANGRWNPEMLQQINVTVQNLQAQAEAKPASVAPSSSVESLD